MAAQLELARAQALSQVKARAEQERELGKLVEEVSKLGEEKQALRERIARKDPP